MVTTTAGVYVGSFRLIAFGRLRPGTRGAYSDWRDGAGVGIRPSAKALDGRGRLQRQWRKGRGRLPGRVQRQWRKGRGRLPGRVQRQWRKGRGEADGELARQP